MAKICPLTNEKVLYLDCNECDDKQLCRKLSRNSDLISSILSDKKKILIASSKRSGTCHHLPDLH